MSTLLSILVSSMLNVDMPKMPDIPESQPEIVENNEDYLHVPILMYHRIQALKDDDGPKTRRFTVEPSVFAQQMQFLSDNDFNSIDFDDLMAAFEGKKKLPEKPVLITFDDGWQEQYDYAFPTLVDYGLKGTFFLVAGYVGYDEFFSFEQAKQMDKYGMAFGSHSLRHRNLTKLTEYEIKTAVKRSKELLEKGLGKPIKYFCYPGGSHDSRVVRQLEMAEYKAAVTVSPGFYQNKNKLFRLKRLHIDNELESFIAKVAGIEGS